MTSSRLFVLPLAGAFLAAAFAQDEKPAAKDNPPPRAERREGGRDGERPPPPRREGDAGEGPRRPPEGRPPEGRPGEGGPRRDGEVGPPRREGGPAPRGEGDFGPPRGEGFGPPPRRDGDFGPPRRPEGGLPGGPTGGPGMGPPGMGGRGGFNHLEQDDPDMFAIMQKDHDLERQTFELAQRFRGAPKAEKEKLKGELSEVVKKHFDIRQDRRTLQMKRVEDDLKRLKDQIEARTKARDEIISRRVTELTGDENDLGF